MPDLIKPEHHAAITELTTKGRNAPARRRAKLLLLYDTGHSTAEVSQQVGLSVSSVLRWRRLYRQQSMGIFPDFEEQAAPASEPTQPDAAPVAVKEQPKKKKAKPMKAKKGKKKAGKAPKKKAAKALKKKGGKKKKAAKALKKKGGKGKKGGKKAKSKK